MREDTLARVVGEVLSTYNNQELVSKHLKRFFQHNRQLGSRDRRFIRQSVFDHYRKSALENFEKLLPHISDQIDQQLFEQSFSKQPLVWIRVKKQFLPQVEAELKEKNIQYQIDQGSEIVNSISISIQNASNLDEFNSFKRGYFEVQDWASQQTVKFIPAEPNQFWWDACAASGGKSLMLLQEEPSLKLFATDIRETVLKNLAERFRRSHIKNFVAEKADLTSLPFNFLLPFRGKPDGIIADVPCTGSGTWARTPEWVSRFQVADIVKFQELQRKIIQNLTVFLERGKPLIYITCSVFKEENEDNIEFFQRELPLKQSNSTYIEGAKFGADTMFIAEFNKV